MPAKVGKKEKKLIELVETAGKMHQVRIYDVDSHASFLKVYIDNTPPVDLKTCEKFMKSLLFLLESEGLNNKECEVSTPGLERPLKKDWHFRSAVGQMVRVTTRQPLIRQGKKASKGQFCQVWKGQLDKYQDQALVLNDGLSQRVIPLDMIAKAYTVFEGPAKKRQTKKQPAKKGPAKKGQTKKHKEKRP